MFVDTGINYDLSYVNGVELPVDGGFSAIWIGG